jgi:hypothetical protein
MGKASRGQAPVLRHWTRTFLRRRPFVEEFWTFCLSAPAGQETVWVLGDTLQERQKFVLGLQTKAEVLFQPATPGAFAESAVEG